jgi:hypothetical protein
MRNAAGIGGLCLLEDAEIWFDMLA